MGFMLLVWSTVGRLLTLSSLLPPVSRSLASLVRLFIWLAASTSTPDLTSLVSLAFVDYALVRVEASLVACRPGRGWLVAWAVMVRYVVICL